MANYIKNTWVSLIILYNKHTNAISVNYIIFDICRTINLNAE